MFRWFEKLRRGKNGQGAERELAQGWIPLLFGRSQEMEPDERQENLAGEPRALCARLEDGDYFHEGESLAWGSCGDCVRKPLATAEYRGPAPALGWQSPRQTSAIWVAERPPFCQGKRRLKVESG